MTKDRFFDAFGQIEPTYVLAAGDILYGGKEVRKPPVRAVRTILIAAAIAVLMTLTAYAAGWFGLSGRLISDLGEHVDVSSGEAAEILDTLRPIHHRDYISLSGVAGSPEYQAAAEWLAFRGSYADIKSAEPRGAVLRVARSGARLCAGCTSEGDLPVISGLGRCHVGKASGDCRALWAVASHSAYAHPRRPEPKQGLRQIRGRLVRRFRRRGN